MRSRVIRNLITSLSVLALLAGSATAQDPVTHGAADDGSRVAELERRVDELASAYEQLLGLAGEMSTEIARLKGDPLAGGDTYYIPRQAAEFEETGLPQQMGSLYTKPFLTKFGQSTYVGGYIDLEYSNHSGSGGNQEFDQHRFVPFFFSDVSDRVKVAAEIEYEHGHELEIEFAQMDFLIDDPVNLRAGIQLLPLGKLNEVHDSPIQELTDRPLVNQFIIPTTLRDAGLGVWGSLGEQVSYNATVTNGFRGLDMTGKNSITNKKGLRNAAPHKDEVGSAFENQNDELAYTGRVAYKPILGTELGVSGHFDKYDERGKNALNIYAIDATVDGQAVPLLPDFMELLYEGAWANIERDDFAKASGVAGDMRGQYVQANVRLQPNFLETWRQKGWVDDGSQFTFVTRYGSVDLDDYVRRRTTVGLNFRPNASHTVVKLDYQFNDDHGANSGSNTADAILLSFASYF
ncbi:MAG: hypothetical protein DRQ55_16610 [Planctomycetota bacterium]|nr:MAG: hypothetical protein DRQ55_16610 [Planctomycetota bacterium]